MKTVAFWRNTLLVSGLACVLTSQASAQDDRHWNDRDRSSVYYDGQRVSFSGDEAIYMRGGTAMLPFRAMGSRIGGTTDRTADGKRIYLRWRNNEVQYDKGHRNYRINQRLVGMSLSSEERHGVLFVPMELFRAVTNGRVSDGRGGGWDNGNSGQWNNGGPRIVYRDREVTFARDEAPFKSNAVVVVPARKMADVIGARFERSDDGRYISITLRGDRVEVERHRNYYRFNGQRRQILGPAYVDRNGVLFIPFDAFKALAGRDLHERR